jgi:tryptophan synthase alpha chain
MNRIQNAFKNGKAFIPFITAGDPDLDTTEKLIYAMEEAGADLIELGVPFSDPTAEGAVIQEANERALANGCTTDKLFDMMVKVRKNTQIPIVYLTYLNPIYAYGKEKFMKKCQECGVDGLIIPDLPYEEKEELSDVCQKYQIEMVSLITPTSCERVTMIAKEAEGFVYCVSSLGVTGVRTEIKTDISEMISLVKDATDAPCAVGFGIATPEQAIAMAKVADGVIVGSAIVKIIAEHGKNSIQPVADYIKTMKDAIKTL